ncbi:hypothetical protein GCE86_19690 [Micromonospora terminaliae]|uniref:Uncharacterized protein n=1 Tax=Micromonospora terminaliae TaxID=1914461 RepID=A0AAJ2ZF01_9ACTN|nr:hypothetical protein [Micromonospora terminaliae]NES28945.1 hypothetical protein [Micromonospora terminaliae]QGL49036.1 hypothetical protein GCE86_19690 [Micromonospora terminaliae]
MRGTLTAAGIILAALVWYAGSCIIRPFRDCWLCDGKGHHRSKRKSKLSRPCRWCRASGKRLRFGRRLWNRARRVHRDAAAGARIAR